ncbi:flagellar export chaperone FliS [Brevibacillus fluminis]|uniref:Flagellar export chaperone FliS n=1 Tax=Brevibacillus fluminis TaxID=511487 RepID=A0A3M8DWT1_9BACL|nr:flagellar export chaperone FliS [Brevibacillus fluminis]RNB92640.1 flagellar export chaperone FliS [Brevibacillus fluminis]
MQTAAEKYQLNQVNTATPAELTLMLYNGAIRFIKQTKMALQENDFTKAHQSNVRVQDIISELIITLDMSNPLSENFLPLYDYLNRRLIEANIKKDVSILDEVEDFLTQFRDTWREAMALAKQAQ